MKTVKAGPTFGNLIAGAWVESRDGGTYTTVNPARPAERIGQFQRSTRPTASGPSRRPVRPSQPSRMLKTQGSFRWTFALPQHLITSDPSA